MPKKGVRNKACREQIKLQYVQDENKINPLEQETNFFKFLWWKETEKWKSGEETERKYLGVLKDTAEHLVHLYYIGPKSC